MTVARHLIAKAWLLIPWVFLVPPPAVRAQEYMLRGSLVCSNYHPGANCYSIQKSEFQIGISNRAYQIRHRFISQWTDGIAPTTTDPDPVIETLTGLRPSGLYEASRSSAKVVSRILTNPVPDGFYSGLLWFMFCSGESLRSDPARDVPALQALPFFEAPPPDVKRGLTLSTNPPFLPMSVRLGLPGYLIDTNGAFSKVYANGLKGAELRVVAATNFNGLELPIEIQASSYYPKEDPVDTNDLYVVGSWRATVTNLSAGFTEQSLFTHSPTKVTVYDSRFADRLDGMRLRYAAVDRVWLSQDDPIVQEAFRREARFHWRFLKSPGKGFWSVVAAIIGVVFWAGTKLSLTARPKRKRP